MSFWRETRSFNFKIIKFFLQQFSVFLCSIEWQQKRSYLLREISLQIKKVERKVWILRNYWVKEIGFLFLLTTLFTFSKVSVFIFNKKFPPHKFASRKTLVSLLYVTVHLILIVLFQSTLNHACQFKENCFRSVSRWPILTSHLDLPLSFSSCRSRSLPSPMPIPPAESSSSNIFLKQFLRR